MVWKGSEINLVVVPEGKDPFIIINRVFDNCGFDNESFFHPFRTTEAKKKMARKQHESDRCDMILHVYTVKQLRKVY